MQGKRYPMGLSTFDFIKIALLMSGVFLGIVILFSVLALIISLLVDLALSCILVLFGIAFITATIFGSLILILTFVAKSAIFRKCPNYVEIKENELTIMNTWNMLYPSVHNTIPIFLIHRIERPKDDYFKERWEKTPWLFKINALTYRPPHGGLYVPYTSKKNILILRLRDPVKISNTNFLPARRPPLMKITDEWVREVIVDIDPDYHDEFIRNILMINRPIRNEVW